MKKIAIVNQRYGLEVNGGSEYYTRLIAEKLNDRYDIEILTTRALNYDTWDNYYPEGFQIVNGIKVRRFSVNRTRNIARFRIVNKLSQIKSLRSTQVEQIWIKEQGPLSQDLIKYIHNNKDKFDIFIFVTYLYYHTVKGLPEVADKAILIPTAHDEPYINFNIYKKLFTLPKAIIYLTEEEKIIVNSKFHNQHIPNDIIGIGIDPPRLVDSNKFRGKFKIQDEYIIYVGRIDVGKNCDVMFHYFIKYKNENPGSSLKLVVMGKAVMEIPQHPDIIYLGFVNEEDKYNGISGAKALILPSEYESLSISVLEAMALSVPVLVNGKCAVLKGHCEKSKGGLCYNEYSEFQNKLGTILLNDAEYETMKSNAKKYVNTHYNWNVIINKLDSMLKNMQ